MCGSLPPSRAHLRGASRSSRTWSAGCDGRGGVAGRAMLTRFRQNFGGPVPGRPRVFGEGVRVQQSRVVLAPRRWCQACGHDPQATGAIKPGPRGERGISCQTIRAGKAGLLRPYLWFLPRAFFTHGGRGCGGHPAFPAPSSIVRAAPATARTRFCAARTRALMPAAV
jgi:hypothetical protein